VNSGPARTRTPAGAKTLAGLTLAGLRVGLLERPHPPGHQGALVDRLVPALLSLGADVQVVHAERGEHRLDVAPPWDLVVLKSGSAAALHVAAAAQAWGVPCVNSAAATRTAQDKLVVALTLQDAGLPVARSWATWFDPAQSDRPTALDERPLVVKAVRGSQGKGVWAVDAGGLTALRTSLPAGPYLVMDRVAHEGEDLKVYAAGDWLTAIERPFPARTLTAKIGHRAAIPAEVAEATRRAGTLLGLSCFGIDYVRGPDGWVIVDVNAFPGYKGAVGAVEALTAEIVRSRP
jgi:ribosomal protein S6--L-glutamate ligase